MRSFKDRREGASVMTPPLIDRSKVAASLLLRCDQSASVSIYVTGLPFPQVTWYLGSRPISDSSEFRVAMDADGRKHTLAVARVTEDLEGGLKVKAVNCAGQDQWEFEVKTYKLFSGRAQSDGNKFTTLPLLQSTGKRKGSSTPSPRILHKKTSRRFEMTQDEYEDWQKEMERRSHMRSIDDILESLSDEDPPTETAQLQPPSTENNSRKSEDNSSYVMEETHPSSSSSVSFASRPPSTRRATTRSFQEQLSSESGTRDAAFRNGPPAGPHLSASWRPEVPLCVPQGLRATAEARNMSQSSSLENSGSSASCRPEVSSRFPQEIRTTAEVRDIQNSSLANDIPLWEMFGVKLSEFCRTILESEPGSDLADRLSLQGVVDGSTIRTRNDCVFVEETSRLSKLQSRSMPVGRKPLGSGTAETLAKLENTRIPGSKERVGQHRAVTVRPLSADDPHRPVTLMPDLRPPMTTQRVARLSEGSASPNARPPLAPKPSLKTERLLRRTSDAKDLDPNTSDASGSIKTDSPVGCLRGHRTEIDTSNGNSRSSPKGHDVSLGRGAAPVLHGPEPSGYICEPSERDFPLQGISSLDRKQNLVHCLPAVDRHFSEVRGETERRRLEIKMPGTTRGVGGGGEEGGRGEGGGFVGGGGGGGRGREEGGGRAEGGGGGGRGREEGGRGRVGEEGGGGVQVSSIEILETHFNEPPPGTGSLQKTPEASLGQALKPPYIDQQADRVKADSTAFPTQSAVIRKKPPIAKDKPSWNPTTGVNSRGAPRTSPALSLKAEHHMEIESKPDVWSHHPATDPDPQSTPSRPILVRRARSQSSGRSDETMVSCEEMMEDISAHPFESTSSVQLSYSQELTGVNPTRGTDQLPKSGIGKFPVSAAKSEGLLTARKRSASPSGAGAVNQNGVGTREWRGVRMPVSKSVDLLDVADSMEGMQRIGRRSLSKEWQVVTVTTKEEITILQKPAAVTRSTTNPPTAAKTATVTDHGFRGFRPQLRPSKPFAV